MTLPQQKNRELVFEILYSYEFHESSADELCSFIMREHKISKKNVLASMAKADLIQKEKESLDALIREVSHSYDLKRIHSIERNILRLAFFELFIEKKNEIRVVIAEALRLARKFTTPEAQGFILALIDAAIKRQMPAT